MNFWKSGKIKFIILLIVLVLIAVFWPFYRFVTHDLSVSPFRVILTNGDFKKVDDGVNILLLGIPGDPYDGPNLSDTILLVRYDLQKNKAYMLPLPRDLWSPTLSEKINAAYALGEAKKKGAGLALARAEIAGVVGQPIPYAAVINFSGFRKLIDEVGGIDIAVERSFTDKKFPIEGLHNKKCPGGEEDESCRVQTISFTKGKTHMDGETALRFVRSREAEGIERGDFARARRQQKVITALRARIIQEVLSLNLPKTKKLYVLVDSIVKRNLTNTQMAILAKNVLLKGNFVLLERSLSSELFIVPPAYQYDGKYVLIPKDGFGLLHRHIACLLTTEYVKKCGD